MYSKTNPLEELLKDKTFHIKLEINEFAQTIKTYLSMQKFNEGKYGIHFINE